MFLKFASTMKIRFFTTAVVIAGVAHQAAAWGSLGHQTVAYLAFKFLSSNTVQYLENILANDRGYDIGDAASWADNVRNARPYSKPWHFLGQQLSLEDITNEFRV